MKRTILIKPLQPRNALSPSVLSPVGAIDLEENQFEVEFNAEYDDGEEPEVDELDFLTQVLETPVDDDGGGGPQFAVLNSSLPDQLPEQHHLASYVTAKRAGVGKEREKKHKTKWHFGIRSRSPPMEVMFEIYRVLKQLGMEWKEKKNLGGLGGVKARAAHAAMKGQVEIERNPEYDGDGGVDLKAASSIYFVETRARVQDVVVMHFIYVVSNVY